MHLISALAAGVLGAESGFVDLFARGTSRRVAYYTDFEATEVGTGRVSLDVNGGASIYVAVPVDVVVFSSSGSQVRRFTDAVGAANVEVKSVSFTGTDYETQISGAGKPTNLKVVLDRWLDSAGAVDFNVRLPDGSTTSLSNALVDSSGVFYNVVSYGATGDGVTDDTASLVAAVAAAVADGGGVVFLPAGTYLCSSFSVPSEVSLLGAGSNASIIKTSATTQAIEFTGGGSHWQSMSSLQVTSVDATNTVLVVVGLSKVAIRGCGFVSLSSSAAGRCITVTGTAGTLVSIDECYFTFDEGGAIYSGATARLARVDIRRSKFATTEASWSPTNGVIFGDSNHLYGCSFDPVLATSGTASLIKLGTSKYGSVRCCEFFDSGGCTVTCIEIGTLSSTSNWFTEDGSIVTHAASNLTLYSYAHSGLITYYCKLGSRESRMKEMSLSATTVALTDVKNFGNISVRTTGAGAHSMTADAVGAMGSRLHVVFVNNDASARALTFGTNMKGPSFTVAANEAIGLEFVAATANNGTTDVTAWFLVGSSGALISGADSSYAV